MDYEDDALSRDSAYYWTQKQYLVDTELFGRFVNWVSGEFDLYQKSESNELKVYFPNGWFRIRNLSTNCEGFDMEIVVVGKSKLSCEKVTPRLKAIYQHVKRFQNIKNK